MINFLNVPPIIYNLIKSIKKSTSVELHRLIFAIGIEEVGETTSRNLANYFGTMDSLLKSSYEDLIAVPDIGPRMAAKITDYIRDIENGEMVIITDSGIESKKINSNFQRIIYILE